ncbi:hypothetical protein [Cerasicoccus fimbriatus]|uniref:hypothetical protein n=1 Tax=Cerasicoccus fimbriatus TaxID=3014554 RepID=UPI0022B50DD5|nr:hypothetical protein [Cerasicoccus sp. TK19100]
MNKRYIQQVSAFAPVQELSDEVRKDLRKNFKPLAARRLTALPLILGELTKNAAPQPNDEWIFASEYGGSISLEKYLESFPTPSPLHFQNSIQPGPLDLINVVRGQSAAQLTPIIGAENLLAESLLAALISRAEVVHLAAGEEYTQWAAQHGLGSGATFGFYLRLSRDPVNALGEVSLQPGDSQAASHTHQDAAKRLAQRQDLCAHLPERGVIRLTWL